MTRKEYLPGIIIAIVAAALTFYFSRLSENKNAKLTYFKTFEIIEASFDWNLSQINRLDTSLTLLKEKSIKSKTIIIDEFPVSFNSSIIQASVDKLIRYKKSDEQLIKLLIFYSNHLEELNYQIKFEAVNKTIKGLDEERIEEDISTYFNSIQSEYLDKLKTEIEICKQIMKNAR